MALSINETLIKWHSSLMTISINDNECKWQLTLMALSNYDIQHDALDAECIDAKCIAFVAMMCEVMLSVVASMGGS